MVYPTVEQVQEASRFQLCKWSRFLRSPETIDEVQIINLIYQELEDKGGFTPEISKAIGW